MFRRFKKFCFWLWQFLGFIFTTSYSGPVKEIQSIEKYSAQVLGEEEEDAEDTSQTIIMPVIKKVEKKEDVKKRSWSKKRRNQGRSKERNKKRGC